MNSKEIKKIARMARIKISDHELPLYQDLNDILAFIKQISVINTKHTKPMAHPLDIALRPRPDNITESNQLETVKILAPNRMKNDLYLVPEVFNDEEIG